MTVYCIDTSSVIDAGSRYYPIDVFPGFWDRLDTLIGEGRLKAPETLVNELEAKDEEWREWVYQRRDRMIWSIDEEIQASMGPVMTVYANIPTNLDSLKGDPFFIAAAHAKGATMITSEAPRRGGVKIPKICEQVGVPWQTLLGVVRAEGWRF